MFQKLATLALALTLALPGLLHAATPVNVNQADAATLAKSLNGIGLGKAHAIVAWREAHGPFKKVDDLRHVKGIGKATIERNRGTIVLADDPAAGAEAAGKPAKPAKAARRRGSAATEE